MITLTNHRNGARRALTAIGSFITVVLLVAACSSGSASTTKSIRVEAIDRTGSTDVTHTWPQEVAGIVQSNTLDAIHDGTNNLVLISIGANSADTAKIAEIGLHIDCSNDNVCNDDRQTLAGEAGKAGAQVANTPVHGNGTDIVAALSTAKSICGTAACTIDLITDGVDKRLSEPGPVQGIVARHAAEFPNLRGTTVRLIGVGADGGTDAEVLRTTGFWDLSLKKAGATDITIARSL